MRQKIFFLLAVFALSLQAQTKEYIKAFTDKDCYLTGEQMLVHVIVTDAEQKPMDMSRVAYVELCDTEQRYTQAMAWLTDGEGWAKIDLPGSMHSGNYQLSAYTRYMRNFGQETYFKQLVSVVNLLHPSSKDDISFVKKDFGNDEKNEKTLDNLNIKTDYRTRELVQLQIPNIEADYLSVSVFRKDILSNSRTIISDNQPNIASSSQGSKYFVPEIEGHIVMAKSTDEQRPNISRLGLVGKRGLVFDGKIGEDGVVSYFTQDIFGSVPVTINGYTHNDDPTSLEFISPYETVLPDSLPPLVVYYDEKELQDRSVGSQIEKSKRDVALEDVVLHEGIFMGVQPRYFYDLNEWTKFKSVREILIEFVAGIRSRTVNKHKMLYVFEPGTNHYSNWPALVLLDGMPVYDIEALMDYDARRLRYVQIYHGRYQFGENICTGVISFISRKGALQDFLLDKGTQMFTYDFPQNKPAILSPIYTKDSPFYPDFRSTLYFNPQAQSSDTYTFYTSDLTGTYEVRLQYIDKKGVTHKLSSEFVVK